MHGALPMLFNTLAGPFDFLDPKYPVPQHILEFTWDQIQKGNLNWTSLQTTTRVLTFHDSCNVARQPVWVISPEGNWRIPRNVIKAVCNNFVDMHHDTIGEKTLLRRRRRSVDRRSDGNSGQRRTTGDDRPEECNGGRGRHPHGGDLQSASQFTKVLPYYGMDMNQIVSIHQLVSEAIILTGQNSGDEEDEEGDEEDDDPDA